MKRDSIIKPNTYSSIESQQYFVTINSRIIKLNKKAGSRNILRSNNSMPSVMISPFKPNCSENIKELSQNQIVEQVQKKYTLVLDLDETLIHKN